MSTLIKVLKTLVLLAILTPAIFWLDQNVGPGYTTSMQQQMLADLNASDTEQTQETNEPTATEAKPQPSEFNINTNDTANNVNKKNNILCLIQK